MLWQQFGPFMFLHIGPVQKKNPKQAHLKNISFFEFGVEEEEDSFGMNLKPNISGQQH